MTGVNTDGSLRLVGIMLGHAGAIFDEVTWRLDGVHPEKWDSPAARAMSIQVDTLRTRARLLQDNHGAALDELAVARAMAQTTVSQAGL